MIQQEIVKEWPTPRSTTEVKQFYGLVSYYRHYIRGISDIAEPLHHLMGKNIMFLWSHQCQEAFDMLKQSLTEAPVLACPNFKKEFQVYTDASGCGLGAVIEQEGRPIAFASRTLTTSERNYSTIQKECLAVVYATKQFCHYLLGRHFTLYTDHNSLQWLSAQCTEGMLCCWSLALQEFDFSIKYCQGLSNLNADALSRRPTNEARGEQECMVTMIKRGMSVEEVRQEQRRDPVISQVIDALHQTIKHPQTLRWEDPTLKRLAQIWSQLVMTDGALYRRIAVPNQEYKLYL